MASNDLSVFTQDENQFGSNVARTKRIIAKLLLDWTKTQDIASAGKQPKERPHFLTAIYFDKLAELFCRIWDQLNDNRMVRYAAAFKSQRGFHGPGRALRINRKQDEERSLGTNHDDHRHHRWAFTTEIVEKLKPSLGNARVLFSLSGLPWKHTCKIAPEMDPSQWESWLVDIPDADEETVFLTPVESQYVSEISRMICNLSKDELRALGTHYRPNETCEDINFNLRSWNARFESVVKFLRGTILERAVERLSYELVSTTREIKRKSSENRKAYTSGWKKCVELCQSEDVKSAFFAVQGTASEIWDDDNVGRYGSIADSLLGFSIYVRRGLNELDFIPTLQESERQESDDVYPSLGHPVPGVSLSLRNYHEIKGGSVEEWLAELTESKNRLFRLIPPLRDLSHLGVV